VKLRGKWPHARHHPACFGARAKSDESQPLVKDSEEAKRSHKRKAEAEPEGQPRVLQTSSAVLVALDSRRPGPEAFAAMGYAIIPATLGTYSITRYIHRGAVDKRFFRKWDRKRCGFYQHDMLGVELADDTRGRNAGVWLKKGLRDIETIAWRDVLRKVEPDAGKYGLTAIKLLRAGHGQGEQEIHLDVANPAKARDCRTVLLYVQPCMSTIVTKLPLASYASDIYSWTTEKAQRELDPTEYVNWPVRDGDAMVFTGRTLHKAPKNSAQKNRYVIFCFFTKSTIAKAPDTEVQFYPKGLGCTD
jgi:hypothetical protein